MALSCVEGSRKRSNYCARGLAVPLFILILGFWFKFIGDDHIISKEESQALNVDTNTEGPVELEWDVNFEKDKDEDEDGQMKIF